MDEVKPPYPRCIIWVSGFCWPRFQVENLAKPSTMCCSECWPTFFNEENSATSGRRWQKFNQKFVLLTMSLQTISETRSERKKASSQIGGLKIPSARGSSMIGTQPHKANTLSHNRMSPKWYQISQYYCTFAITDPSVGICWISINYKYIFFGVI